MKICAATAQERKDYLAYLPLGMEAMYDVIQGPITIKNIHTFYLLSPVNETIIISSSLVNKAKVFGSEENKLMNFFITNFPGFTFKVVKM